MISYEKIKIFFDKKTKVHISCNGRFYNGLIIEINNDKKFLILNDIKIGEMPIMFEEILSIEPFMEVDGK